MREWKEEEKVTTTASEDFKTNLQSGKRYVDKTDLLISLLGQEHETTFFLRPRRFGKTLTLSMIRYFVEDTRDENLNAENRELFQGLKIMEAGEQYTSQMTSYPVINLTMQTVMGENFKIAYQLLEELIRKLYQQKKYLLSSSALDDIDKCFFDRILRGKDENGRKISVADLTNSLKYLSEFLRRDSGRKVIVLIDEYDVPLEKAYQNNYYRKMVNVIGPLLQGVLKTNTENLQFAVITGCLRIAKEGIYTGLNNPDVNTVLSNRCSDVIGFTEEETRKLLADSGVADHFEETKEWYDGYRFGNSVIYNPWSVIKYIEDLKANPKTQPQAYWANTSGNAIIRELANHSDEEIRKKLEILMQGGEIDFSLRDNIVYDELYEKADNVWNVMLAAGYLTAARIEGNTIYARIPNHEVLMIYEDQIEEWFHHAVKTFDVRSLYDALERGAAEQAEQILTNEFLSAMSYYDTMESFYHGVLLTLLQLNRDYMCESNRESGSGRFDVAVKQKASWKQAFVFEVKVSKKGSNMLTDAKRAAAQVEKKKYTKELQREGYRSIMTYGIAFCEKRCRVIQGKTFCQNEEENK